MDISIQDGDPIRFGAAQEELKYKKETFRVIFKACKPQDEDLSYAERKMPDDLQ